MTVVFMQAGECKDRNMGKVERNYKMGANMMGNGIKGRSREKGSR